MAFCPMCGTQVPDGQTFCPSCGASVGGSGQAPVQYAGGAGGGAYGGAYGGVQNAGQTPAQYANGVGGNTYGGAPYGQPQIQPANTGGLLAWAIITLLLCMIPGIVALVKVNAINKCYTYEDQQAAISSAKTWCIIGTVLGLLPVVLLIVLTVTGAFAGILASL